MFFPTYLLKRVILVGLFFSFLLIISYGQEHYTTFPKDTIVSQKRAHLKAALGITSFNTIINRYDAYIKGGGGQDFANITFSSWWKNISGGLEWDWNPFYTNWAGHPYHGALMYNTARSGGLSFWQSVPYSIGGAMMWEFLGETHPPSTSDLVTTGLGGIYVGEVLFRTSELILDDRTHGWDRAVRETLAFILNPASGLNRLISGSFNQHYPFKNHTYSPTRFQLSMGGGYMINYPINQEYHFKPYIELGLLYGDRFTPKASYQPFEIFNLMTWVRFEEAKGKDRYKPNMSKPLPYWSMYSYGILFGKSIHSTSNENQIIGLFQHFDYLNNKAFEVSALGLTGGWIKNAFYPNGWSLLGSTQVGIIALGASNSEAIDWVRPPHDYKLIRDYIMGSGLLAKADILLEHPFWGSLMFRYGHWTIFVASGPEGRENIDLFDVRYQLPFWGRTSFGLEYIYYLRKADYSDFEASYNRKDDISEIRLLLSYSF